MAQSTISVADKQRATAKTIPVSPITSAPSLTHQRDLVKRAETVESDTCGWVNGDLNTPLVCEYPSHQPCLWSPELHAVGCCSGPATTDCAWVTSCVPWSQVNYGCDEACQKNHLNTVCDEYHPLCATATFGGPEGYTYLSCTDTYGPTHTMEITYYGGNATVEHLPRYFSSYWYSQTSASYTSTSHSNSTSTSTHTSTGTAHSTHADSDTVSWFSKHKIAIIGAIAGVCGLVLLLFIGCCFFCRRKAKKTRGNYVPASQQMPPQECYPMQYQSACQPSYQASYHGQPYEVYASPHK